MTHTGILLNRTSISYCQNLGGHTKKCVKSFVIWRLQTPVDDSMYSDYAAPIHLNDDGETSGTEQRR